MCLLHHAGVYKQENVQRRLADILLLKDAILPKKKPITLVLRFTGSGHRCGYC